MLAGNITHCRITHFYRDNGRSFHLLFSYFLFCRIWRLIEATVLAAATLTCSISCCFPCPALLEASSCLYLPHEQHPSSASFICFRNGEHGWGKYNVNCCSRVSLYPKNPCTIKPRSAFHGHCLL